MRERGDDDIDRAGVLAEKTRRRLFTFVASRPGDVDRDEAAAAAGISRPLAAFHLDRLVQAGLLEATFRRPAGRGGPGAGRPAKRYRRSSCQLALTLPERRYELAAGLLAQALEDGPQAGRLPLLRAARSLGRDLGSAAIAPFTDVPARGDEGAAGGRDAVGGRDSSGCGSRDDGVAAALRVLESLGYAPTAMEPGAVGLRNCPFEGLVRGHVDLVCGMNLALVEGIVEGAGAEAIVAVPDAQPGWCCVRLAERRPEPPIPPSVEDRRRDGWRAW